MSKHLQGLAAILPLLVGLVSACQPAPAVASLVPVGAGPLVTVTVRGGDCPEAACGGTTVIERDGRVHQIEPAAAELGDLPDNVLTALDAAVKTTDFDVIRARQFTGECPVAFDGQEFIYEFGAPEGTERIATCETEVDPNHPLFAAVSAALAAAPGNQPGADSGSRGRSADPAARPASASAPIPRTPASMSPSNV
jgi:hypothetical protein